MYNQNQQGAVYMYSQPVATNQAYQQVNPYGQGVAYQQLDYNQQTMINQFPAQQNFQQPSYYVNQPMIQDNSLSQMQSSTIVVQPAPAQQPQQGFIVMAQPAEVHSDVPTQARTKFPTEIKCRTCGNRGITTTKSVVGQGSWAMGLALFCCGCWPCACLPCCLPDCMDTQHLCSVCGTEVGRKQFLCDD